MLRVQSAPYDRLYPFILTYGILYGYFYYALQNQFYMDLEKLILDNTNIKDDKKDNIVDLYTCIATMKFCSVCDNMYYIGISEKDGNQLTYYCRNCGHNDDSIATENVCVLKTQMKKSGQNFHHIINEYTKLDPTLPRIYNMKCPNPACKTNSEQSSGESRGGGGGGGGGEVVQTEVVYIRYDDNNMKYLYMCVTCDTAWKTDGSE